jgi:heme/copper-type cytochrome/quinol oxidase subunit 3
MITVATDAERSPDSTSASLGMTLFLAAEGMFFLGLLSALFVIGPAHRSATELSKVGLAASILCLIAMSALAFRRPWPAMFRCIAIAVAVLFLGLQALQYWRLERHETIVAPVNGKLMVLDGIVKDAKENLIVTGTAADLPDEFDPHDVKLPGSASAGTFTVAKSSIRDRQSYGPGRSNFFSCYFILTTVHAVHLIGGMIALAWVTLRKRARIPAVELYWHTMNAIGIVCLIAIWLA